jgi:16S rRNA (uracil1498-N3)-methyltransferase
VTGGAALGAGLPVFRAEVAGLAAGALVELAAHEARHAAVRRLRQGDAVLLTDGRGHAATCEVEAADRSSLTARVTSAYVQQAPRPRLTVVQAVPKGERADLAVEALTEVGVDRIVAWQAERCVAVWRGERAEKSLRRWRTTADEAAKQARRVWWPEVEGPASLADVVALVGAADRAVVLHESARLPLAELAVPLEGSVVVVVGPEGGITDAELTALADAGGHVCRLGDTVLRTSTAGLAACAALLAQTTRWA